MAAAILHTLTTDRKWMAAPLDELVFDDASSEGSSGAALLDELRDLGHESPHDTNEEEESKTNRKAHAVGERRRKHRESMARFRQERRTRIKQLDTQMQVLHKRLRKMLQWILARRDTHEANNCPCLAYADLVQEAESLLQEQYTLEDTLYHRNRFSRLMSLESQRVEDECQIRSAETTTSTLSTSNNREGPGYWVQYQSSEPAFYYEAETIESTAGFVVQGLHAISRVHAALTEKPGRQPHGIASCLGWKTERTITRDVSNNSHPILRFRFTKSISRLNTTIENLQDQTWHMLRSTELTSHIYGAAVHSKIVQEVSDDAFILLRNSPNRDRNTLYRQFNLNVRLQSKEDDAALILIVLLDKAPRQEELEALHGVAERDGTLPIEWIRDGGACLRFAIVSDDVIEVEYVGFIVCAGDEHADYLLLEACAALLRWEHLVIPPRLLA